MVNWWSRRSFKVRLTLWYALVTALVLAAFAVTAYEVVEHRLEAELERQLRIDFDLIEAQLHEAPAGTIRYPVQGAHGDEGFARLSAWFEVWSEGGALLLRHWPVPEASITSPLGPPAGAALRFREVELEENVPVRLMERPARIGERGVVMRVFRDESDMRRTLGEVVEVFMLILPLAVLAASLGAYWLAWRSLRPVAAMAEQAQKITMESLAARLPNPNPGDEFGQLAAVFNATLQRLENSFLELRRFTADASHELRTPLTSLRTVGEVALQRDLPREELRETIGSMLEEAEQLDALAASLLELARLQSEGITPVGNRVDVSELSREVAATLALLASEKEQTIEVSGSDVTASRADSMLLRQALLNILHNAIRYSPRGALIRVGTASSGAEASIRIADQGPGIAPEHRTKIFERFYRVDRARSRQDGGYGLGLAIAKWSVERQGGRIEVQDNPGGGCMFRIVLPSS
jgi:two-component system, OmpR family, sensor kinase